MDFSEYQKLSRKYAFYRNLGNNYDYPLKGLFSEVGEIADKFKKVERDKGNVLIEEDKNAIGLEIGDSMWYLANLATELGLDLTIIAKANLEKLESRFQRNKLGGAGDYR